ncbi:MAG: hypothetical protein JWS10_3063 [Cypionkella sp.]|nr:hypothetical protein [Cypionkella sp.]
MTFPPLTPTYPHLPPTLQKPITSPPTPTLYRGVGVGVGEVGTAPSFPLPCIFHGSAIAPRLTGKAAAMGLAMPLV